MPIDEEGANAVNPLMEKISLFKMFYDKEKQLKVQLAETVLEKENIEAILYEAMVYEGIQNIKTDIGLFYLLDKDYASIKPDLQDEFFEYLKATDNGTLIRPSIHSQTLTSWVKEQIGDESLEDNEELSKYITIFTRHKVGVRSK